MTPDVLPARGLAVRVEAIESELAALRPRHAADGERIAMLERSLEACERALDPEQMGLPLPGIEGEGKPAKGRKLTRMGEAPLREAMAREAPGVAGWVDVDRTSLGYGRLISAKALAKGEAPLFRETGRDADRVVYEVTPEGEKVARALPVIEAAA